MESYGIRTVNCTLKTLKCMLYLTYFFGVLQWNHWYNSCFALILQYQDPYVQCIYIFMHTDTVPVSSLEKSTLPARTSIFISVGVHIPCHDGAKHLILPSTCLDICGWKLKLTSERILSSMHPLEGSIYCKFLRVLNRGQPFPRAAWFLTVM